MFYEEAVMSQNCLIQRVCVEYEEEKKRETGNGKR